MQKWNVIEGARLGSLPKFEKVFRKLARRLDARIIDEVRSGTATYGKNGIVTTPDDVGGWPELQSAEAPQDSGNDGMPDDWEKNYSLDSAAATVTISGSDSSDAASFVALHEPGKHVHIVLEVTDNGAPPLVGHLRAVISWAWEQEIIAVAPRFPKPRPQRDVAGRHYLTKAEMNSLYFATHALGRPRGWNSSIPVGRYPLHYSSDSGTLQLQLCLGNVSCTLLL